MDDPRFVRRSEGRSDLSGDVKHFIELRAFARHVVAQGLAVNKLGSDEVEGIRLPDLVDSDDVWVIKCRRRTRLLLEAVHALGVSRELGREQLERDSPA